MNYKIAILKDLNLLIKAKQVFGADFVLDAYVCVLDFNTGLEDITRELNHKLHTSCELNEGDILYDAQHIRLVFCNGKVVDFRNSEWASMGNLTIGVETYEVQEKGESKL